MSPGWIEEAIPGDLSRQALAETTRSRISDALDVDVGEIDLDAVAFVQQAWELALFDALESSDPDPGEVRRLAEQSFRLARNLDPPVEALAGARFFVKLGCLGLLADRQADAARLLSDHLPYEAERGDAWGERTEAAIWSSWLRLVRKNGWADLDAIGGLIGDLREAQEDFEAEYLEGDVGEARARAWELVAFYHLAHAAELLAEFVSAGSSEGHFDVRQQLDGQFDRAVTACACGELVELEVLIAFQRRGRSARWRCGPSRLVPVRSSQKRSAP